MSDDDFQRLSLAEKAAMGRLLAQREEEKEERTRAAHARESAKYEAHAIKHNKKLAREKQLRGRGGMAGIEGARELLRCVV